LSCSLRIWGAFAGDRRSRRFAGSGAAVVAFAAVAALLALAPSAGVAAEHNTVVKRFTNGTSHNSVGIVDASEDAQEDGPQAIYAADDGGLYLLDQVNGRILRFDAKAPGGAVQSLELPQEMRPTDIVVRRGNIYVWDGAPRALLPTGRDDAPVRGLTQTRAPDAPDNFTLSAFAQMGSQPLDSPAELLADPNGDHTRALPVPKKPARQFVATRGHGSVYADVVASEKRGNAEVDVREQDTNIPIATLRLQVRDRIGVVEFLEIDNTSSRVSRRKARWKASTTSRWTKRSRSPAASSRSRPMATSIFCARAKVKSMSSAWARAMCGRPPSSRTPACA
jgi:hypothetical protein